MTVIFRSKTLPIILLVLLGCDQGPDDSPATNEVVSAQISAAPQSAAPSIQTPSLPLSELSVEEPTPDDHVHIIEMIEENGSSSFGAFGAGHNIAFSSTGMSLSYVYADVPGDPTADVTHHQSSATVSINFVGSKPDIQGEGLSPFATTTNVMRGNAFIREIQAFEGIRYPSVYPGIDLYFIDSGSKFSFVFVVHPGANADAIRFTVSGGEKTYIDTNGSLITHQRDGTFEISKPISFQSSDVGDLRVDSNFAVDDTEEQDFNLAATTAFAIKVGDYADSTPLVIDPTINFATLLGTTQTTRLAVEATSGDVYVAGSSANHSSGVFYVARHDRNDGALLGQTLIFSGSRDTLRDIFVVGDDVFIAGDTRIQILDSFVSDPPPVQSIHGGQIDAFAIRLDRLSLAPEYGTFFGGAGRDFGIAIRADLVGNIYLAGYSDSPDFPSKDGPTTSSGFDNFVAKFLPTSGADSDVAYARLVGGSLVDNLTDADLDDAGNFYLVGRTNSPDFPLIEAMPIPFAPATVGYNPFLAKVHPNGDLVFSSYAHNNDVESGVLSLGMDVSRLGDAIAFGGTLFDIDLQMRGYVAKVGLDPETGRYRLIYTHKPPGTGTAFHDVALDRENNLYGVGESGAGLPTTSPTLGVEGNSAFLYVLGDSGGEESLLYAKSFGGLGNDRALGVEIDLATNVLVIAGTTTSNPFTGLDDSSSPITGNQGFLVQFAAVVAPPPPPPPPPPNQTPVASIAPIADVELKEVLFHVTPRTLNKKSKGRWVKGHLALIANTTTSISLDASASQDPDGDELTYLLQLEKEGITTTYEQPNASVVVGPGFYKVTVKVCDIHTACASAETTFSVSEIDLKLLKTEDFSLNGEVAQKVTYESGELSISFSRTAVAETVAVGDSIAAVLSGAIDATDYIRVIDSRKGNDDTEDHQQSDLSRFWEALWQKIWNVREKIWEYFAR